jgi:hypothetical protein
MISLNLENAVSEVVTIEEHECGTHKKVQSEI